MSQGAQSGKNWSRVAALYAKSVNENDLKSASGAACTEILKAVDETLPFSKASFVVDMGCGNGQVISRLFNSEHAAQIPDNARLVAADVSQEFVEMVKERKKERSKQNPLWERLEVHQWDAIDLHNEIKDGGVSHLLGSFAYFSFKSEKEALAEAHRILKPGGIFVETSMGFTEWGHLPQFIREIRPDKTIPGPKAHW
jgi:ubiquinone/menaquinone biosynthesis C-methylase UbiE